MKYNEVSLKRQLHAKLGVDYLKGYEIAQRSQLRERSPLHVTMLTHLQKQRTSMHVEMSSHFEESS